MNIALIGYGKMGRTIEALGKQQGIAFPLVIDLNNRADLNSDNLKDIDVAIEFSIPESAPGNILSCIDLGIPVVSGTTGWNERLKEVTAYCIKKNGTFFYASNFSIGVNILFAMNRKLAQIMDSFPGYSVTMEEAHHVHKLDAPSGTAITLADQIIIEQERINSWSLKPSEESEVMHINAIRKGEVKGIHTIMYESDLDTVSLTHEAKTRDAFATGVLLAAEFIKKRTGVFGMTDMLNL